MTSLGASPDLAQLIPGSHRPHPMAWPRGQLALPGCVLGGWGGGGSCPRSRGLWPAGAVFLEGADGVGGLGQGTGSSEACPPKCGEPRNGPECSLGGRWDEGEDGGVSPWPSPCPAPSLLVPQSPPPPPSPRRAGPSSEEWVPALPRGDCGQTGPSRRVSWSVTRWVMRVGGPVGSGGGEGRKGRELGPRRRGQETGGSSGPGARTTGEVGTAPPPAWACPGAA